MVLACVRIVKGFAQILSQVEEVLRRLAKRIKVGQGYVLLAAGLYF